MKFGKWFILFSFVLLCMTGIAHSAVAQTQGERPTRDGFIPYDALVDDKGDIIIVGQTVKEIVLDDDGNHDSKEVIVSVHAGMYVRLTKDFVSKNALLFGNQTQDGGIVDSAITNVWDWSDGKKLVYVKFDSDIFMSEHQIVDVDSEICTTNCEGISKVDNAETYTLRKVVGGYLFGGYTYTNTHENWMVQGDAISFYDTDFVKKWEICDQVLEGGRYKKVIETDDSYIFLGDVEKYNGKYYPSAFAVSKNGVFLWRNDYLEVEYCTIVDGTYLENGNIALLISGDDNATVHLVDINGSALQTHDLYREYSLFNPTSIVEMNSCLIVSGNKAHDTQAALVTIYPGDEGSEIMEYTKDDNGSKQVTYLVKESNTLAYAYGFVEYDDNIAQVHESQKYHSFVQSIIVKSDKDTN